MIQNLINKLNEKFPIFFYVFTGLEVVYSICFLISLAVSYNPTVLTIFYYIARILVITAFFGFGAFLLFKKDNEKFRKYFNIYVLFIVVSNIFSISSVFGYSFYQGIPAILAVANVFGILSVVACGAFAVCYFVNLFYPNEILKTVTLYALIAALAIEVVCIIIELIGTIQGYKDWDDIISAIEGVSFYLVMILGLNNKEICD